MQPNHIEPNHALAVRAAGSVMDYVMDSKLRMQSGEVRKAAERWCDAYDTVLAHINKSR
ncbi:hypothetical protein [Candidatus Poriferisodalis sp.]|uniref:hypothetical protein n=1 Tax=Candidatus Poriferisodalis sp. TaxID=3101277 RepID=UPI003B018BB7